MIPELKGFALVFGTTHKLLHKVLEGLTPEQAMESRDGANPILWVAAHTVVVRASFAKGLGAAVDVPWGKSFARGAEVKDVTTWPKIDEVRSKWDEVHAAFTTQVDGLSAEQAAASTPVPGLDGTVLGVVGLAALHDAYHIGQLSAARRRCGLDRIVG
jgi:uncharacterized damage-inducible protein DinB